MNESQTKAIENRISEEMHNLISERNALYVKAVQRQMIERHFRQEIRMQQYYPDSGATK